MTVIQVIEIYNIYFNNSNYLLYLLLWIVRAYYALTIHNNW